MYTVILFCRSNRTRHFQDDVSLIADAFCQFCWRWWNHIWMLWRTLALSCCRSCARFKFVSVLELVTADGTLPTAAVSHLLKQGVAFIVKQPQEMKYLALTATVHQKCKTTANVCMFLDGGSVKIWIMTPGESITILSSLCSCPVVLSKEHFVTYLVFNSKFKGFYSVKI